MKKILSILVILLFGATSAMAANNYTRASKSISNYGTLSFQVDNEPQDDQNSSTDVFVVDRKVDLVVAHADSSYVIVNPNNKNKYLTFTVRNDGNDVQDYHLTFTASEDNPWGVNEDNLDMDNVRIFVDKVANGNPYKESEDTETYIDQLDPDANRTVFIVVDVPGGALNGKIADYTLLAATREGNKSGEEGGTLTKQNDDADDPATVQNVFADADGNGIDSAAKNAEHSDWDAFKVEATVITFAKWSIVIEDPVVGKKSDGNEPKRIPGATLRYCFEINNTGDKNASDLSWTDQLDENLTYITSKYDDTTGGVALTDCVCTTDLTATGKLDGAKVTIPDPGDSKLTLENNNTICAYIDVLIK